MKPIVACLTRCALAVALSVVASTGWAAELRITHPLVEGLGSTAVDKILQDFRDQTGIWPRIEVVSQSRYRDLPPDTDPASLPDAAFIYAESLGQLAQAGLIVPLDELLDAATRADFAGRVLDTATYQGRLWALPIQANTYALFCNVELFRQAGVKPPRTWDEALAAARKLTRDTDGDGRIDTWGYSQCVMQYPLIMWQYGGEFLDEEGSRVGFEGCEDMIDALAFYVRLRQCSPQHVDFERGDMAMKLSVVRNIPRYAHLDFRVIPVPTRNGRCINAFGESAGALCLVVFKQGDEKEQAAKRLVRHWLRPSAALWYSTWTGSVPLRKSVLAGPAYQRYLRRHPHSRAFASQLPCARARPCLPEYARIKDYLSIACNTARDQNTTDREELRALLDEAAWRCNLLLSRSRPRD